MHYIPYNSHKLYHKSPFGAVTAGSQISFRVILPHSFGAKDVWLAIRRDEEEGFSFYPLSKEKLQGDGEQWWALSYTAEEPGLYFYDFCYDTECSREHIYNCGRSLGQINCKPAQWQLTVYDPNFKTPEWLKGGVIYQIFPDRFYASGEVKSSVPQDRILRDDWGARPQWQPDESGKINSYDFFGGDLKGIEEKLSYLGDLGVTCIYLNPIFEAHSNHRYDTADYLSIDPLLGDEDDFKSLCKKAAEFNIKIILDGVFSHTGADSIYFNKFNRYPTQGAYNSQDSPYFPWFKFNFWPDDYESWWGVDILPELKEEDPGYVDFIVGPSGVLQKWLKLGAKGWRLDVADELPDVFLGALRKSVKETDEEAFILGEVWEDASNKISHGGRRRYLLGGQLDSVMNYPLSDALLEYVTGGSSQNFTASVLSILENYPKPAIDTLMNHLGTHDTLRILSLLGKAEDAGIDGRAYKSLDLTQRQRAGELLKLAATILYCLPGVPGIYYGDEVGLEGGRDPYNRACFPWDKQDTELFEVFKALGKIRKDFPCLAEGVFEVEFEAGKSLAFSRSTDECAIICLANASEHEAQIPLDEAFENAGILFGQAQKITGGFKLKPHSASILFSRRET